MENKCVLNLKQQCVGLSVLFSLLVTGCTTTGFGPSPRTASITSTQGVAAPSGLVAALDGGLIARIDGLNPSKGDLNAALQGEYRALEYTAPGEAVSWQSRQLQGKITPSQPYRVGSQDCRQYMQTVTKSGAEFTAKGTACRNEDGSWSLLS